MVSGSIFVCGYSMDALEKFKQFTKFLEENKKELNLNISLLDLPKFLAYFKFICNDQGIVAKDVNLNPVEFVKIIYQFLADHYIINDDSEGYDDKAEKIFKFLGKVFNLNLSDLDAFDTLDKLGLAIEDFAEKAKVHFLQDTISQDTTDQSNLTEKEN